MSIPRNCNSRGVNWRGYSDPKEKFFFSINCHNYEFCSSRVFSPPPSPPPPPSWGRRVLGKNSAFIGYGPPTELRVSGKNVAKCSKVPGEMCILFFIEANWTKSWGKLRRNMALCSPDVSKLNSFFFFFLIRGNKNYSRGSPWIDYPPSITVKSIFLFIILHVKTEWENPWVHLRHQMLIKTRSKNWETWFIP